MRSVVFDEDDMRMMMMRMTVRAARIVRIARTLRMVYIYLTNGLNPSTLNTISSPAVLFQPTQVSVWQVCKRPQCSPAGIFF